MPCGSILLAYRIGKAVGPELDPQPDSGCKAIYLLTMTHIKYNDA